MGNKHGRPSLLHIAAQNGDSSLVQKLLREGQSVHLREITGSTPLHYACSQGQTFVSQLLIDAGADVNAADKMLLTPLHIAAVSGHAILCRLLCARGASIAAAAGLYKQTPLHFAVASRKEDAAKALVEHGSDIYFKDSRGQSPLDFARNCGAAMFNTLLNTRPVFIERQMIDQALAESERMALRSSDASQELKHSISHESGHSASHAQRRKNKGIKKILQQGAVEDITEKLQRHRSLKFRKELIFRTYWSQEKNKLIGLRKKKAHSDSGWSSDAYVFAGIVHVVSGYFGGGVGALFQFMRWVFTLYFCLSLLWCGLIILPWLLSPPYYNGQSFWNRPDLNWLGLLGINSNGVYLSFFFYGGYQQNMPNDNYRIDVAWVFCICTMLGFSLLMLLWSIQNNIRHRSVDMSVVKQGKSFTFSQAMYGQLDFSVCSRSSSRTAAKSVEIRLQAELARTFADIRLYRGGHPVLNDIEIAALEKEEEKARLKQEALDLKNKKREEERLKEEKNRKKEEKKKRDDEKNKRKQAKKDANENSSSSSDSDDGDEIKNEPKHKPEDDGHEKKLFDDNEQGGVSIEMDILDNSTMLALQSRRVSYASSDSDEDFPPDSECVHWELAEQYSGSSVYLLRRVVGAFVTLILFVCSGTAVVLTIIYDEDISAFSNYAVSGIISFIKFVMPFLLLQVVNNEHHPDPAFATKTLTYRAYALNMMMLLVLLFQLNTGNYNNFANGCNGTVIGMTFWRLLLIEVVVRITQGNLVFLGWLAVNFKIRKQKDPRVEYDHAYVSSTTNNIAYRLAIVWMGSLGCPVLPFFAFVGEILIFLSHYKALQLWCRHPCRPFEYKDKDNVFLYLALLTLVLSIFPNAKFLVDDSGKCGPFVGGDSKYQAIPSWVNGWIPDWLRVILQILGNPMVVYPFLILLIFCLILLLATLSKAREHHKKTIEETDSRRRDIQLLLKRKRKIDQHIIAKQRQNAIKILRGKSLAMMNVPKDEE